MSKNTSQANNKRIAKNTFALYARMLVSTLVTLYTSRVVLDVLGVEDFGVYGVIGGVVGMLGFLNTAMAGATSRFLTFELAKGDSRRLNDTFSSAFIIHVIIALIIAAVCETIGLWFLKNKLIIPDGRMTAALWVFHLSIIEAVIGIIKTPYNAVIFAHEKMGFYAYVEILRVVLKLVIVYLLILSGWDKLITYAILGFCVQIIIYAIYRFYCTYNYEESHFRFVWEEQLLKPLFSFSWWNMFKDLCVTIRRHGTNFVVNIFFGVALNAASAVATSVDSVFKGLTDSIVQASGPQIIKLYADGQISSMQKLIIRVFKITVVLMGLVLCPLFICICDILQIWLKEPPIYTDVFCRYLLISSFFALVSNVLYYGVMATGQIKSVNITNGLLYLLDVIVVYVVFRLGGDPETSYLILCVFNVMVFISNLLHLKIQINKIDAIRFITCLFLAIGVILLAFWPSYLVYSLFEVKILRIICVTGLNGILLVLLSSMLLFNKSEREYILNYIRGRLKR